MRNECIFGLMISAARETEKHEINLGPRKSEEPSANTSPDAKTLRSGHRGKI
jgi:hypothetical protein